MSDAIAIEVCVDSAASAVAAQNGGATRVELCSNLLEGGVTPSAGLIQTVRSRLSVPLHVIIRPRGGDFCYAAEEFEAMRRDILIAKDLGAEGVALGILHFDGSVDIERSRKLCQLARPLSVTFHRAFDMAADPLHALEHVCTTGVERILTSGGKQTALEGVDTISRLIAASRGAVRIMAAGGIHEQNVREVIERTSVREIHVGLRSPIASRMSYRNEISLGAMAGREYQHFGVSEENVRALRSAVQEAQN